MKKNNKSKIKKYAELIFNSGSTAKRETQERKISIVIVRTWSGLYSLVLRILESFLTSLLVLTFNPWSHAVNCSLTCLSFHSHKKRKDYGLSVSYDYGLFINDLVKFFFLIQ